MCSRLCLCMYVLTWWFTFKCACVMSVHVSMSVHDVWSHNFFGRHTAIWHKFNEKTLLVSHVGHIGHFIFAFTAHICRPSLLPQFLHICWVSTCPWVSTIFEVLIFSVGTRHFGTWLTFKIRTSPQQSLIVTWLCLEKSYSFSLSCWTYRTLIANINIKRKRKH